MRPMLATPGALIPNGPEWAHEIKWDGMRILADITSGRLALWSRKGNDMTATFPELSSLAGPGLPHDMMLDGEVVSLDDGRPSFAILSERIHVSNVGRARRLAVIQPVTYLVFDLLRLDGVDLTARALAQRRTVLERIDLAAASVQVPPTYDDGYALQAATLEQGLEGIVSKRLSSRYRPGVRSPDWLKFPHRGSRSVVIGGWRLENNSASRLGAVLVGIPTRRGLVYLGRVGSGLAGKQQDRLLESLRGRDVDTSPFVDEVPRIDAQGTRWVRPEIVVEVQSLGLSAQGRLRQPAYHGLRPDLSPDDLREDLSER